MVEGLSFQYWAQVSMVSTRSTAASHRWCNSGTGVGSFSKLGELDQPFDGMLTRRAAARLARGESLSREDYADIATQLATGRELTEPPLRPEDLPVRRAPPPMLAVAR